MYVRQHVTDAVRPATSITAALEEHRHLVVTGQAGSGKSTLAFRLTASLSAALLPPPVEAPPTATASSGTGERQPLVPIRVAARTLAARLEQSFAEALAQAVTAEIGGFLGAGLDPALLRRRWHGMPWLIIVDGLDEVVDVARRQELLAVLRRHAEGEEDLYRLLITTRPLSEQQMTALGRIDQAGHYEIALFNRDQRRAFAEAWFRDSVAATAETFLRQADQGGLTDLMAVPLLATVAAVVFEDHPGRGLPHSRYELYERYFSLVYESRAATARQGLTDRLRGWPGGAEMATWLSEHLMDLVDHLAEAALRDTDLLPAALAWLRAHDRRLDPEPPDWSAVVAAAAGSTGLLTYAGSDLKFVHHTFAEHRNASRVARTLPDDFDAGHQMWSRHLAAARGESGGSALAVLAHHAFLHGADFALLDRLTAGDDESLLLAARLLSEGVPAEPRHFAAVAEQLHLWVARESEGRAEQAARMLRYAAALPARPEVVDVLGELLADETTSVRLRLSAAQALLTYGESHATPAVLALSFIAGSQVVPVDDRLAAVQVLLDHRRTLQAASALRQISREPGLTVEQRRLGRQLDEAVEVSERRKAAAALRIEPAPAPPEPDVEPEPKPAGTRLLHAAVRAVRYLGLWEFAPAWLERHGLSAPRPRPARVDPAHSARYPHRILDWVSAQVTDGVLPSNALGPLRLITEADPPALHHFVLGAARLLVLSDQTEYVAGELHQLVESRRLGVQDVLPITATVAPRFDDFVLELFRDYVRRSVHFTGRAAPRVVDGFAAQGPAFARAAAVHLRHVAYTSSSPDLRVHVLGLLAKLRPEEVDQAREDLVATATPLDLTWAFMSAGRPGEAAGLLARIAGPDFAKCPRYWLKAVGALSSPWGGGDHSAAVELLHRMATGGAAGEHRTAAANDLVELDRDRGLADLKALAQDDTAGHHDRLSAARVLVDHAPEQASLLADVLRSAVEAESDTPVRVDLAVELARVDPHSRETFVFDVVRDVVGDREEPLDVRSRALAAMPGLGSAARRAALGQTARLIGETGLDLRGRLDLATEVSRWSREFQRAAESAVEQLGRAADGAGAVRIARWIRRLDHLGDARSIRRLDHGGDERWIRIVRRLLDSSGDPATRALAARELARDPEHRAEGVQKLVAVAANGAEPGLAVAALYEAAALGGTDLAVAGLRLIALDGTKPAAARDDAARMLLMLDPGRSPESAGALRAMAGDPTLVDGISDWLVEARDVLCV